MMSNVNEENGSAEEIGNEFCSEDTEFFEDVEENISINNLTNEILNQLTNILILIGPLKVPFVVNKIEVSMRSKVLAAHIYEQISLPATKSIGGLKEISFPYLDPSGFTIFLNHLNHKYTFEELNEENIIATHKTANFFGENQLEEDCIAFIEENLKKHPENAFKFLEQEGDTVTRIPRKCLNYINSTLLESDQFFNINFNTLCLILRDIDNVDELAHFNAMHHWAEFVCIKKCQPINGENLREILGDAINYVRFPNTYSFNTQRPNMETFILITVASGILTSQNFYNIGYGDLFASMFPELLTTTIPEIVVHSDEVKDEEICRPNEAENFGELL
uniref:Uncharacterized protein n=1 Tax=Acrobeloides nanus TaxID=290746 RepID=A0A914E9E6_9BILA